MFKGVFCTEAPDPKTVERLAASGIDAVILNRRHANEALLESLGDHRLASRDQRCPGIAELLADLSRAEGNAARVLLDYLLARIFR